MGGSYRYERSMDTQCPNVQIVASNRRRKRIGQFPCTHNFAYRYVYPASSCSAVHVTCILAYKVPLGEAPGVRIVVASPDEVKQYRGRAREME